MTHKFKTGDTGLTRNGRPYRVIADDAKGGAYPIVALISYADYADAEISSQNRLDGSHYLSDKASPLDLMPPVQSVYINVYEDDDGLMFWRDVYSTRGEADEGVATSEERLGCIRVELVRGRFDD